MQYYIASSLSNAARVNQIESLIKDKLKNPTWSYDWTVHTTKHETLGIPDSDPETKRRVAEDEVYGVKLADVLIVIMPGGRGTHFEMGLAFALGKRIVILNEVDELISPSFHFLDGVARVKTEQELLELLKLWNSQYPW